MRRVIFAVLLFIGTAVYPQQHKTPVLHKFAVWGKLDTPVEKVDLLIGFYNGFFLGPRPQSFLRFMECLEDISYEQAVAMIDKYYSTNPEKWNVPTADGIISALTVKGGPCEGTDPTQLTYRWKILLPQHIATKRLSPLRQNKRSASGLRPRASGVEKRCVKNVQCQHNVQSEYQKNQLSKPGRGSQSIFPP